MPFDWRTLLSGVGSVGAMYSRNRQQDRAAEELMAGQARAAEKQRQADALIGEQVTSLASSGPGAIQEKSLGDYSRAINVARQQPTASVPSNIGGDRYARDTKTADLSTQHYAGRMAGQLSKIDAPTVQRQHESQGFARAGEEASNLGREATTEQFLANLAARRHRPNPWVELLSDLATQIGTHYEPTYKPQSGELVPGRGGGPKPNWYAPAQKMTPGSGVRKKGG